LLVFHVVNLVIVVGDVYLLLEYLLA